MEKFDFEKYRNQYDKDHYKQFKAKLKPEEKEKLDQLIKCHGFNNNRQFLLACIEYLDKKKEASSQ